jgi:hypothetical protein
VCSGMWVPKFQRGAHVVVVVVVVVVIIKDMTHLNVNSLTPSAPN